MLKQIADKIRQLRMTFVVNYAHCFYLQNEAIRRTKLEWTVTIEPINIIIKKIHTRTLSLILACTSEVVAFCGIVRIRPA